MKNRQKVQLDDTEMGFNPPYPPDVFFTFRKKWENCQGQDTINPQKENFLSQLSTS